jgi:putative ABC transport system substrate-binding protein
MAPVLFNVKELDELREAFSNMARDGANALVVLSDARFNQARREICSLAAQHRLPAIYEGREFVEAGGLMSYGPDIAEMTRRSAILIDKVSRGARPAELPVELPTRFELIINLKTANALGLTIPPSIMVRADEVIE